MHTTNKHKTKKTTYKVVFSVSLVGAKGFEPLTLCL